MSEPLDSAEVETVASPVAHKRIYVYRITNENGPRIALTP